MSESKTETVRVVCMGTRVSTTDKKLLVIQRVDDAGVITGKPWHFTTSKPHGFAGAVYDVEAVVDGDDVSIHFSTMTFIEQYADSTLAAQWTIQSKAAETELAALAQARKAKRDDSAALACLAPLMKAYHSTNAVGKLALEVRVLHYLRTAGNDIKR